MKKSSYLMLILSLFSTTAVAQETKVLPGTFWLKCTNTEPPNDELLMKINRKEKKVYMKVPEIHVGEICFENEDAIWISERCNPVEQGDGGRSKRPKAIFNKWNGMLNIKKIKLSCQVHENLAPMYK